MVEFTDERFAPSEQVHWEFMHLVDDITENGRQDTHKPIPEVLRQRERRFSFIDLTLQPLAFQAIKFEVYLWQPEGQTAFHKNSSINYYLNPEDDQPATQLSMDISNEGMEIFQPENYNDELKRNTIRGLRVLF